jgi:phage tail sheath protein FI
LVPGTYYLSVPPIPATEVPPLAIDDETRPREGVSSLDAIEDISIICVPDIMSIAHTDDDIMDAQSKVVGHCDRMKDRMAILDTPDGQRPSQALDWRLGVTYSSNQAALYYPWLQVKDPITGFPLMVPPCGHVAGVWARTDSTRGVHKAPANEAIIGITGLGYQVTSPEQGELNRSGLNCIRSFPGRGIRVWGARTISADPEWRYVNVRRLFNFISDSIMQGTQWAVFEPNDERLWIQLQIAVSNFLTIQWRNGALFGGTPDQAFYVKCDGETNPPDRIEMGQVTTEIGIAPVKPAEFVVFQISQYTAGEGTGA